MKTKSAKAKGRRLAQTVQVNLLEACPDLSQDDVRVTPSGVQGPDIQLSPAAQKRFPYAIECKNVESLCFSSAWRQSLVPCPGSGTECQCRHGPDSHRLNRHQTGSQPGQEHKSFIGHWAPYGIRFS